MFTDGSDLQICVWLGETHSNYVEWYGLNLHKKIVKNGITSLAKTSHISFNQLELS
jgi:hypothetical protein